jgi:hypothetical protein
MTHTKLRPTSKVDFSEKNDDPLDFAFRHCRIMERDAARLVRTFTGKVPRFPSTRKRVRQDKNNERRQRHRRVTGTLGVPTNVCQGDNQQVTQH